MAGFVNCEIGGVFFCLIAENIQAQVATTKVAGMVRIVESKSFYAT